MTTPPKAFPPRVSLFVWDNGERLSVRKSIHQQREEYLSAIEHESLLRQARAEAQNEIARLRAFISGVYEHCTCPATALVAGQVLHGHDVRPFQKKAAQADDDADGER